MLETEEFYETSTVLSAPGTVGNATPEVIATPPSATLLSMNSVFVGIALIFGMVADGTAVAPAVAPLASYYCYYCILTPDGLATSATLPNYCNSPIVPTPAPPPFKGIFIAMPPS